jgi:hypothetical protein
VIPEVGLHYRLAKWLRVGAAYRLEYERDGSGDLVVRHRIQADGRARADFGDLRVGYELKVQEGYRPSSNDQLRFTLRNEVGADYRAWKRWAVGGSLELHHEADRDDPIHLDKIWLTFGAARRGKRDELAMFYRLELPQYDAMDPTVHIVGAALHHDL